MRPIRRHVVYFAAAIVGVAIAGGVRWSLSTIFSDRAPFITFFPVVFVLSWWGGFWPAFYAAILSALVLAFAILDPVASLHVAVSELRLELGIFVAVALGTGWLGEKMHAAKLIRKLAIEQARKEGEQLRLTIAERRRAEESLNFLASASTTLAALADRQSALQQAARLPIPFLADWCVVYVIDERGEIDYHAHAHRELQKEALLGKMLSKFPLDWSSNTATVQALRTGRSQLMDQLPEPVLGSMIQNEEHREMVRMLGPQAVISVPLKIREKTIGVIGLVSCDRNRRYGQREVELAESLAQRVAVAVDNARLFHAVKEASRHKDEFLAMLAHELRNPLAAIKYAVTVGQMSPTDSPLETYEVIDRQTQNLAHLIEDLLDVSRISRDKVTLRKEAVDVAAIINRAATTVRPLIEERKHELILELPSRSVYVFVDPTRAEQIVVNLLTNAAKYTKSSGRVTVRVSTDVNQAVIDVIDTGVGMPPELLNRVFDLFAQAERTLDRSGGGLGIGLTVAQKLAEMHGGTITANSEGVGKGSTFTFRMPVTYEQSVGKQESRLPTSSPNRLSQKVLVVDDNRDTAVSCARLLKGLGHEVQTAFDGLTALEVARSFKPQIILLDIGIPEMNGYEVAKALREEGSTNERIIAISGYGQPEDRERTRQAGFDDLLVKPVSRDALVQVLEQTGKRAILAT